VIEAISQTFTAEELAQDLREIVGSNVVMELRIPRDRRGFIRVTREGFKPVLRHLMDEYGFRHLSTMTVLDVGGEVEVICHLV